MNRPQEIILLAGVATVAIIGLFPPWNSVQIIPIPNASIKVARSVGHASIFSPPPVDRSNEVTAAMQVFQVEIDSVRLIVEFVTTLVVIVGLILFFRHQATPSRSQDSPILPSGNSS